MEHLTNTSSPTGPSGCPLLEALRGRPSRRFGVGMRINGGPFTYASQHPPQPLSEEEGVLLAFAAGGVTGYALAELIELGQRGELVEWYRRSRVQIGREALQARTVVVPNAGHMATMEAPETVNQALMAFLDQSEGL